MSNASSIALRTYDGPGPTQYLITVVRVACKPLKVSLAKTILNVLP